MERAGAGFLDTAPKVLTIPEIIPPVPRVRSTLMIYLQARHYHNMVPDGLTPRSLATIGVETRKSACQKEDVPCAVAMAMIFSLLAETHVYKYIGALIDIGSSNHRNAANAFLGSGVPRMWMADGRVWMYVVVRVGGRCLDWSTAACSNSHLTRGPEERPKLSDAY